MILRRYKFGQFLKEENQKTKGQRIIVNQNLIDKARAELQANPSLQTMTGGKFVKSLTQDGYNRKQDRKKDGQKAGAHNVNKTEGTDIDFGAGKTTVSRFNQLPDNCASKKAFGSLVGDIKRTVDRMANLSKSAVPEVKAPKPVPPVHKLSKEQPKPEKVKVPKALQQ